MEMLVTSLIIPKLNILYPHMAASHQAWAPGFHHLNPALHIAENKYEHKNCPKRMVSPVNPQRNSLTVIYSNC